jgi:hypothetical protein
MARTERAQPYGLMMCLENIRLEGVDVEAGTIGMSLELGKDHFAREGLSMEGDHSNSYSIHFVVLLFVVENC